MNDYDKAMASLPPDQRILIFAIAIIIVVLALIAISQHWFSI